MTTLHITDLSTSKELDGKAMAAVRGGADDQAIGTSQMNLQSMLAASNVGNGSGFFGGPANIQSDNTFHQDATNTNTSTNVDALLAGMGLGGLPGRGRGGKL
ncbi:MULTISPECIES: hypothetical protein [Ramlibacter]|uniref:Uncharacterized protein n=1 Tax=Ramlibacter pinisoli TaxID=2682844 RepID=A0A6N8IZ25_9BURK|nr:MULTISPECIES: hypothetical protein [Ramlibacter]MBA2962075.1 hypothetical protein [Ramlibacter sp. CGMCC 1.13660]MVQ32018.1 hypothetical protein [Ramlibacter pinisoli]